MKKNMQCPKCGTTDIDLTHFQSMMLVSQDEALFTLQCPHCGNKISSVCAIPAPLQDKIKSVASELDAGMGRDI